jgi:polyhydroxybutyrate depolymerase
MERISLESGGNRREYLLKLPPATNRPLLVFLHGMGATAQWAEEETGWSRLAEQEGFVLALPEARRADEGRPPKFLSNPQRWNDGAGIPGAEAPDDVRFLSDLIEDVTKRKEIDSRRIYLCGFSNGAAMVFRAASELSARIAAIAPVAGYCWVDGPCRPIPTHYLIGSLDPLVPLRGGDVRSPWRHRFIRRPPVVETLDRWARAIGCEIPSRKMSDTAGYRVDEYAGPVPYRVTTVEGLGHHWPGGKGGLNPQLAGPMRADINGTELVWEFLKGHHL